MQRSSDEPNAGSAAATPRPATAPGPAEEAPESLAWRDDQLRRGRSLVDALTDQLAAGQVETLYALHTAAATVRREGDRVEQLTVTLHDVQREQRRALQSAADSVADQVTTQLTDRVERWMNSMFVEHLQPLSQALVASTQAAQESLSRAALDSASALADVASALEARIASVADDVSDTLAASAAALNASTLRTVEGVAADLERTRGELEQTATAARDQLRRAGQQARTTLAAASEHLVSVSAESIDGIDHVGATMGARTDAFLTELDAVLTVQAQRDAKREADREARVLKLVTRTDTSMARTLERLERETDWLSSRDERQELLRADAFVRALESLLDDSGGRLRSRVRDVLAKERRRRDDAVSAPTRDRPSTEAAEGSGEPVATAPDRDAAEPDDPSTPRRPSRRAVSTDSPEAAPKPVRVRRRSVDPDAQPDAEPAGSEPPAPARRRAPAGTKTATRRAAGRAAPPPVPPPGDASAPSTTSQEQS